MKGAAQAPPPLLQSRGLALYAAGRCLVRGMRPPQWRRARSFSRWVIHS